MQKFKVTFLSYDDEDLAVIAIELLAHHLMMTYNAFILINSPYDNNNNDLIYLQCTGNAKGPKSIANKNMIVMPFPLMLDACNWTK
jgi:hypothetical protein